METSLMWLWLIRKTLRLRFICYFEAEFWSRFVSELVIWFLSNYFGESLQCFSWSFPKKINWLLGDTRRFSSCHLSLIFCTKNCKGRRASHIIHPLVQDTEILKCLPSKYQLLRERRKTCGRWSLAPSNKKNCLITSLFRNQSIKTEANDFLGSCNSACLSD